MKRRRVPALFYFRLANWTLFSSLPFCFPFAYLVDWRRPPFLDWLRSEFYYIQMEKYARQALAEGVKNAEEIRVGHDAELVRVLNVHYNRNNHINVSVS